MAKEFYQVFIDNSKRCFEISGPMTDAKALERKAELEKGGRRIDRFAIHTGVTVSDIASNFAQKTGLKQVEDLSAS
jgi:hypothetical protein